MQKYSKKINWTNAPDVKRNLTDLVKRMDLDWVDVGSLFVYRSCGANTRAYARVWGLSRIWQQALKIKPSYIIEVISEKYDALPQTQKDKIILHELTHIPKNFSGALVAHTRRRRGSFHDKLKKLNKLYEDYRSTRG